MRKERAYIAGPMTNLPHFNFPTFDQVAERCRRIDGWKVYNPHERDQKSYPGIDQAEATKTGDVEALAKEIGFSYAGALSWDLAKVAQSEHIVLLPGWEKSSGARTERFVAEQTGSRIWLASLWPSIISQHPYENWNLVLDNNQKRMASATVELHPLAHQAQVLGYRTIAAGVKARAKFETNQRTPSVLTEQRQVGNLPHLVGITGFARAGKDAIAETLVKYHGYRRFAFADALKQMALAINPLIDTGTAVRPLGAIVSNDGWEGAKSYPGVRTFLQRLGTEGVRGTFGDNAWVDLVMDKVAQGSADVVISDVRFENEAKAIWAAGGEVWLVTRPGIEAGTHASEQAWYEAVKLDRYIVNDGSLQDLTVQVLRHYEK